MAMWLRGRGQVAAMTRIALRSSWQANHSAATWSFVNGKLAPAVVGRPDRCRFHLPTGLAGC